jgi:pimeloyl-ACP methyl ester carboxylesterase
MSFDLPGLGLADRPVDLDFTFAGLGRFAEAAVDALGLERLHLVVHDAGGPVGFELAGSAPVTRAAPGKPPWWTSRRPGTGGRRDPGLRGVVAAACGCQAVSTSMVTGTWLVMTS